MNRSIPFLFLLVLMLVAGTFAQRPETFDIATFQPPTGWERKAGPDGVQFSTEDKATGAICLITLFKSVPGLGSSKENFDAAWRTVVTETVNVTAAPQMQPSNNPDDWKVEMGSAPFEKDGLKGAAVLVTASGYGKMMNALILTNTQAYEPQITAFLESFSFKKPEVAVPQAPAGDGSGESIVGVWGLASSSQRDPGQGGYIKNQYTFNANGTYEFLVKTFQYTMQHLLFTRETGTYQLNRNSLTIIPQKSTIQAWTKGTVIGADGRQSVTDKWGKLVSTQNRKLEKVTYQISKHYFSGIQEWNLVMQAATPNDRDGPFTGNTNFPNSWLYKVQKFPIDPPR